MRLENVIADAVAEERGDHPAGRAPHVVAHRGWGCTLDREIGDRGGGVLEIKTVDWLVRKRDQARSRRPTSCCSFQAQLGVTGREWGAVAALVGGNELRIWGIPGPPRIIAEIAKRVRAFWKSIRENRPPPVDGSPSTADTLAALYPNAARPMLDQAPTTWPRGLRRLPARPRSRGRRQAREGPLQKPSCARRRATPRR